MFLLQRVHAMQLRCWTVGQWEAKGRPMSYAVDKPCTYALQGGQASPVAGGAAGVAGEDADDESGDGVLLSPEHPPLSPKKKGGGRRTGQAAAEGQAVDTGKDTVEESPAAEAPAALLKQMSIDPATR